MSRGRIADLAVRATVATYRIALRRYPADLRRRFGARMLADFRTLLDEEVARSGLPGGIGVCLRMVRDLFRPLPRAVRSGAGGPAASANGAPPVLQRRTWGPRTLAEDLRGAWRSLRRRPQFTALVVVVLATGIALNTSIFAVVGAYLLRPLPYPDSERLVEVRPTTSAVGWTDSGDIFEKAVSWNLDGYTLVGDPAPEIVLGARVSPDFFDLYGVRLALGRGFGVVEAGAGAPSVAVISHALWMRRFGGDPDVLGRTVRAFPTDEDDGLLSLTVVGVLPADFWYVNRYTDVLVPLDQPGPVYVGRLRTDVPPARAQAMIEERARAAGALRPDGAAPRLRPLGDAYAASVRPQLLALQAAALLVLLAACASAGLLTLVRATGRGPEMGVRRALGAGDGRLAAHLLGEGAILAALAGLGGTTLGWGGLRLLGGIIEARVGRAVPGGVAALRIDATVLVGVLGVVALVALVLGLVPLWVGRRGGLARTMGGRGATETAGARRMRGALVTAEVALALTLLSAGALLVRSALHLQGLTLGFDPAGLTVYTVGFTSDGADDPERRAEFFRAIVDGAGRLDGVASAGLARAAPFSGDLTARALEREGGGPAPLPDVVPQIASVGYFTTLGITARRGRLFASDDGPGADPVAVVNASLAEALGGERAAVGARVRFPEWDMVRMSDEPGPWVRVIGVVADVGEGIEGPRPTLWVPYTQAPVAWMDLLVRRRGPATDITEAVRGLVRDLDENTPLYAFLDLSAAFDRARAPSRFFATLLAAFSLFSFGLALLGLYGVAAYAARQRRRDLAVRLALGAPRGAVEGLFLREAAGTVALGVVIGFGGGRWLGAALQGQLHGVRADEPATAVSVAALVAATGLLAVWLPARRAARQDVSSILREE